MRIYLDVETSGLLLPPPVRSTDPDQPHIVELAALLENEQNEIVESMVRVVRPDGWIIPAEATRVHGITQEQALAKGIPEPQALEEFMTMAGKASMRAAHNEYFDMRIIRIALLRYWGVAAADHWRDQWQSVCTLKMAQRSRKFRYNGLNDVHRALFQADITDAHKAMADVLACRRIYHELSAQLGELPLAEPPAPFRPAEFF